jgi:hypothetical protein
MVFFGEPVQDLIYAYFIKLFQSLQAFFQLI